MEPLTRKQPSAAGARGARLIAGAVVSIGLVLSSCGDGDTAEPDADPSASVAVDDEAMDDEPMDDEPSDEPMDDEPSEEPMDDEPSEEPMDDEPSEEPMDDEASDDEAAPGVYRAYSEEAVTESGYDTTILFFHASWCPECRAFEQAIEGGDLADGVQILKVDYDSATDLRQRYDVTMQTTFVRVDETGEREASWVGYGKDRSVEAIMNELG